MTEIHFQGSKRCTCELCVVPMPDWLFNEADEWCLKWFDGDEWWPCGFGWYERMYPQLADSFRGSVITPELAMLKRRRAGKHQKGESIDMLHARAPRHSGFMTTPSRTIR